uniref:Uncharacterized protein n=1 Tax=Mucochytrium quahogii TaxID=96639 RepID=A0A7S2WNL5_9STRA
MYGHIYFCLFLALVGFATAGLLPEQPALMRVNIHFDQTDFAGREMHSWNAAGINDGDDTSYITKDDDMEQYPKFLDPATSMNTTSLSRTLHANQTFISINKQRAGICFQVVDTMSTLNLLVDSSPSPSEKNTVNGFTYIQIIREGFCVFYDNVHNAPNTINLGLTARQNFKMEITIDSEST